MLWHFLSGLKRFLHNVHEEGLLVGIVQKQPFLYLRLYEVKDTDLVFVCLFVIFGQMLQAKRLFSQ